ncbi:MAG TPA: ornithine--oxo-acid transaminase [Solirubrobacteraceae bacterium]|jgi:ornithine--oxo-acid transaminase
MAATGSRADELIALELGHGAHNYHPLGVVIERGEGPWVWDVEGKRYFDALAAYSALNFGHRHPGLVAAAEVQLGRLTLTSRAFHSDQLGPFCAELAAFCGKSRVLPMNTGAEGVETAIKLARKWGHTVRGIAEPKIVVCEDNFHGRTTTIISFSDDPLARDGFGPYTPGFVSVPYGDAGALREALRDESVLAFLVEPVQGEAGVVVPPDGYLRAVREACTAAGVLMIADEIQSGLGRAGARFACDHEDVQPDLYILGKALGGGIVPLSAVVGDDEVLGVLRPGEHGSTFGGNPLACAVGREVLRLLDDRLIADSSALGAAAAERLRPYGIVRQRGLWLGIDIDGSARAACEQLMTLGVLCKDTHETTLRIAPPLTVSGEDLDWALDRVETVLRG